MQLIVGSLIWRLAEALEKNDSKLIISSHGGYVENCINFDCIE